MTCFCIGPQNGDPACPCEMRSIQVLNGRYVKVTDLGPAPNGGLPSSMLALNNLKNRLKAPGDGKCCHKTVLLGHRCEGCPHQD